MKNLTKNQLFKACEGNNFLKLRFNNGDSIAINGNVAKLKSIGKFKKSNEETSFISYTPISFMEYISIKTPFINTKS